MILVVDERHPVEGRRIALCEVCHSNQLLLEAFFLVKHGVEYGHLAQYFPVHPEPHLLWADEELNDVRAKCPRMS
jgi:hypothetical protein